MLLNASVLCGELVLVIGAHNLLEHGGLPLLARQPGAVELGGSGDDLADLRILGGARAEGLLLVLGVQDASHAEELPIPLELGGEDRLGEVEPVGSGCSLVAKTC